MTKIALYIHSKCTTCKKAVAFLEKHKKIDSIVIKDITVTPPSLEELKKMLKSHDGNIKKLFNTSGMLYREMKLSEKLPSIPLDEALQLLSENGMLVKRPFLIGKGVCLTGFREPQWVKAIKEIS